jgi:pyruvate formate lyase activating enzyme
MPHRRPSHGHSPVFAFHKKPTMIDFTGHLAAMFFTSGCNFSCGFCHNAGLLGRRQLGLTWGALDAACQDFRRQWVKGVVITGGEPTLHADLPDLIRFFKERHLAVKLDTNGSRPDMLEQVLPLLDAVAMDIKCAPDSYAEFVGFADAKPVIRSVTLLRDWGRRVEFRTTILESRHTEAEMRKIGDLLRGASHYTLQPFLPREDLPLHHLREHPRTPQGVLHRHAELLRRDYGITVAVRGDL